MLRLALLALLSSTTARADTCRAQSDELGKFLTTMDHDLTVVDPSDVRLVVRDDIAAAWLDDAPVLRVATGFALQDRKLRASELAKALTDLHATLAGDVDRGRFPKGHPMDISRIIVLVDDAARWDAVVTATRAAAANGFATAVFVFARTPKTAPPPASPIDAELATVRDAPTPDRVAKLAELTKKIVSRCPTLIQAFGAVSSTEVADRTGTLLRSVGPAVLACNCNVEIPSLRSVLWAIAGNPHPIVALSVKLDGKATPIDLPAATPWREASQKLGAKTQSAWLGVK